MASKRTLEQHIAVFGEAGSGKTVLVSSFYGAAQEQRFEKDHLFRVVADSVGQGAHLHQNYLGMKNKAEVPEPTVVSATAYSFSMLLKNASSQAAVKERPFDALKLVWHDYPGEWFESDVSGPVEAKRRIDAFRSLLGSDVALLLVDGQKLIDSGSNPKPYLKSLFTNFRNGLLSLRDELLTNGAPLVVFPRIWILALSKCDLHPELNARAFRDLLTENAAYEIGEFRDVISELVDSGGALSVGEDYVLLSSAKFDADKIEVDERVGLDLIPPIAAVLPLERKIRWAQGKLVGRKVAADLLGSAGKLGAAAVAALVVANKAKLPAPIGAIVGILGAVITKQTVEQALKVAEDKMREIYAQALVEHDFVKAMLAKFALDLDQGEDDEILLRSRR